MITLIQCCELLEQQKLKIAFIESASSGYLASQFSIYKPNGSKILLGGLISYDPSIKIEILKIDPELIVQYSAESMQVTAAMAIQGKTLFVDADIIVSCTGLLKAGGSATSEKPVGTFFICIQYLHQLHRFHYLLNGKPIEKLDALTNHIALAIIQLLRNNK